MYNSMKKDILSQRKKIDEKVRGEIDFCKDHIQENIINEINNKSNDFLCYLNLMAKTCIFCTFSEISKLGINKMQD